jgi:hypothetical protein
MTLEHASNTLERCAKVRDRAKGVGEHDRVDTLVVERNLFARQLEPLHFDRGSGEIRLCLAPHSLGGFQAKHQLDLLRIVEGQV